MTREDVRPCDARRQRHSTSMSGAASRSRAGTGSRGDYWRLDAAVNN
ncbi:unnamed protein product [Plutella xylostella]|uniref:(diamondback moth) hypothetical protein n=1 Tax=Plutella xylostella TaxID=51655 RepID=A0A8S4GDR7_PLUXY|nr:unnamed protein product [Plutella xylostella]